MLLLPLGVRESDIPSGFLADMTTFGAKRGDLAHRSVGARVPPNPVDTNRLIIQLILGLRRLDRRLLDLKDD